MKALKLTVTEQAAQWLLTLPSARLNQRLAFTKWLKASPEHVREYLLVSRVYHLYDGFDPQRRIPITPTSAEVVPFRPLPRIRFSRFG